MEIGFQAALGEWRGWDGGGSCVAGVKGDVEECRSLGGQRPGSGICAQGGKAGRLRPLGFLRRWAGGPFGTSLGMALGGGGRVWIQGDLMLERLTIWM